LSALLPIWRKKNECRKGSSFRGKPEHLCGALKVRLVGPPDRVVDGKEGSGYLMDRESFVGDLGVDSVEWTGPAGPLQRKGEKEGFDIGREITACRAMKSVRVPQPKK